MSEGRRLPVVQTEPRLSAPAPTVRRAARRPAVTAWRFMAIDGRSAAEQMAIDEALARQGEATLRLFRWSRPALSLGYRQPRPAWIDPERWAAHGVELVERPTGGGIAVHGTDLSCSVVAAHRDVPDVRGLMDLICESVAQGLRGLGIPVRRIAEADRASRIQWCLTEESPYALMVGAKKICGFAIRRYAATWLVQGSMLVWPLSPAIERALPRDVAEAFGAKATAIQHAAVRKIFDDELTASIAHAWRGVWGVACQWVDGQWPRDEAAEWLTPNQFVQTKWWRGLYAGRPASA